MIPKQKRCRSKKVLIDLFQKVVGIEGATPLIDLRRGRNTHDI